MQFMSSAMAATGSYSRPVMLNEVVAVCESPAGFNDDLQQASLDSTASLNDSAISLQLIRTARGYDIVTISAGGERWSASKDGLALDLVMNNGTNMHVVLQRESGLEHFLFMLGLDGTGNLMWSSAANSARTTCQSTF